MTDQMDTGSNDSDSCYVCKLSSEEANKWIGCSLCSCWAHVKCASLSGVKPDQIHFINWVCFPCLSKAKFALQTSNSLTKLTDRLAAVEANMAKIGNIQSGAPIPHPTKVGKPSYAVVLKSNNSNAVSSESIAPILHDLPIKSSRQASRGGYVLRCESPADGTEAADRLRSKLPEVSVHQPAVAPLRPKITVANIPLDMTQETFIASIRQKTRFLANVLPCDLTLLFITKVKNNRQHAFYLSRPLCAQL